MNKVLLSLTILVGFFGAGVHADSTSMHLGAIQDNGQLSAFPELRVASASTVKTPSPKRPKILLIQGANLSYLGRREPELYGTTSAAELDGILQTHARTHGYDLEIFYTHIEGEAIGRLYRAVDEGFDGVVMNPGGFTYAGYALRDCLRTLPFPYVEVHVTNLDKRGIRSATAEVAVGVISGFGTESYVLGLDAMLNRLGQLNENAKSRN